MWKDAGVLAVRRGLEAGRMTGWGARKRVSGHAGQGRESCRTSSLRTRPRVSFPGPRGLAGAGRRPNQLVLAHCRPSVGAGEARGQPFTPKSCRPRGFKG